ncbi:hypothetical protein Pmar_PMAR020665 [Perkinsus marinus ATCC 50983]|uniref:Uncharacterized protein n=1 Tax=Perkinsus marinus (strain ATCC 50983 / TXsc) TaxID=423536 RepID=C5L7N8_PERM5|nr:hypothetical protein Pmar_PMAR020665 [Perkinsus marinus ATCC 50983]EER07500.1 hypothetical protein Pmar_PMAR020665 [Perkinsus marinus ATCC 50983]|eukprot:XP_002775684.1 hypothetical protein Pmar_PMAR020665 [Perkinsus marinus ATCC 50983]
MLNATSEFLTNMIGVVNSRERFMMTNSDGFKLKVRGLNRGPQVMESDGDLDFTEEVETLRLSNRHLTVEVKTLRAEILKMKRDASRVQEAPQLSIDHKDGGVEEMQELQDARVRRLEYQKSSLETERDRLKEEVRQISEMYVKLWSEGTSSSDGLREEVVRLKEENESLRSRIRELIKRREDVVSEPESLAEGI